MIRKKNIQNSSVARNCPYGRRNPNAVDHLHRAEVTTIDIPSANVHLFDLIFFSAVVVETVAFQKFQGKKMMTAITDGGDLVQLNQFLAQRRMYSLFHLIDSTGPPHCPVFTMRLSICDQTRAYRKSTTISVNQISDFYFFAYTLQTS